MKQNRWGTIKRHKNQVINAKVPTVSVYRSPLTQWRMDNKVGIRTVANLLGVNESTVSRWESGDTFPGALAGLLIEYMTEGSISMYDLLNPADILRAQESLKRIETFKGGQHEKMRDLREGDSDDEDLLFEGVCGESLPEDDSADDAGGEEEDEFGEESEL